MEIFDSQALPDRPPDIPGYDAVRCLGTGAQGHVWLMAPHNGSAPVAAKFMTPPTGVSAEASNTVAARHNETQITHEWRVLAQFRHEHLIAVQRIVQASDGGQVLLMDYAAGGSLGQIIHARGPLTVGEAVTVLTPMGQVLAFLHGRGAVHGDMSPGNILFSAAGKPYLADFGFARLLGQEAGVPTGTLGFHCPEDASRNEAADVFALAAIGWFALTGRTAPPTHERLPLGTFVRDVPAELVAALEAGLNENPAQRPSAAAFAQAVFRSSPAEALALGNAVHPSVVPQLPTRHGPAVRGGRKIRRSRRRRARTRESHPRQAPPRQSLPRQSFPRQGRRRQEPAQGGWGRLPNLFVPRQPVSLSHLWASGPQPAGRAGRAGRPGKKVAIAFLLVGSTVVAAAVLVAATMFGGSWAGFGLGGTPPGAVMEARGVPAVEADMAWAAGLPADIRQELTAVEPVAALHALAWVRCYALAHANQALIDMVNAPGSAALVADSMIVQELVDRSHTLTGLEIKVSQARTTSSLSTSDNSSAGTRSQGGALPTAGSTVTVRATIATSAFAEQDQGGALVHHHHGEQIQELDIVMANVGARWRIQQILATAAH